MGDHTESLQVDFSPDEISFQQVADLFWRSHNPCASRFSRQYMSAIWYHNDTQKIELEMTREELAKSKGEISTPIEPLKTFYLAENYHQKYRLQRYPELMKKFQSYYPEFERFNNSMAAARLNGLIGGNGPRSLIDEEIGSYGFPREELQRLFGG